MLLRHACVGTFLAASKIMSSFQFPLSLSSFSSKLSLLPGVSKLDYSHPKSLLRTFRASACGRILYLPRCMSVEQAVYESRDRT